MIRSLDRFAGAGRTSFTSELLSEEWPMRRLLLPKKGHQPGTRPLWVTEVIRREWVVLEMQ